MPGAPASPVGPSSPGNPGSPCSPLAPLNPAKPSGPEAPTGPGTPVQRTSRQLFIQRFQKLSDRQVSTGVMSAKSICRNYVICRK